MWCSYTSYQHFISRRLSACCPGIFEFFSQAKVPEKYGSQEIQSEETKSEEKRHPACEKHTRANHLLAPYVEARPEGGARTEKEIGEKV